jgi:hypothetical protein
MPHVHAIQRVRVKCHAVRSRLRLRTSGTFSHQLAAPAVGLLLAALLCSGCSRQAVSSAAVTPARTVAAEASTPSAPTLVATTAPRPTPTPLPSIGDQASAGDWSADLRAVDPMDRIGNQPPQGRFVVVTVAMTNLHKQTSDLNSWDFALKTADGLTFQPARGANNALAFTPGPTVPVVTVQIQPGLTQPLRIAFDVDPGVAQYTFEAAKIPFQIQLN